jgi:hypothetical protein
MGEVHAVPAAVRMDRRDEVATRCPYCREDVRLEAEAAAWTACALCLARHHAGCWDELARCASCGDAARLAPVVPPPERVPGALGHAMRGLDLAHRVVGIVLGSAGVAGLIPSVVGLVALPFSPPGSLNVLALACLFVGSLVLLGTGLGLRAASMRWVARPRVLPRALMGALLGTGPAFALLLGVFLGDQSGVATFAAWLGGITLAWTLLVAGVALSLRSGAARPVAALGR